MKLPKIDGNTVKGFVEWLKEQDCGCCHFHLCDTDNYRMHICIGWHEWDEDDGLGPVVKVGNSTFQTLRHKNVWKPSWKIGMETFNNGMQCDLDIDFIMPYDEKTGDVYDTLSEIGEMDGMDNWNALVEEMNKTAAKVVKWQLDHERMKAEKETT